MPTIALCRKTVFGIERLYIEGTNNATAIRRLTGRRTVELGDIESLKMLGFTVTIDGVEQ